MTKLFRLLSPFSLLILAFLIWIVIFKAYFLGQSAFSSDAISYYEHIHFFIKSLSFGEIPFWDPYWSGGVPNEFFLRRICPYNPLLFPVLLFFKLGVPFYLAYLLFLSFYVFLGAAGVYFLMRRLTGDISSAFLAAVLLLFSAFSTRIFDSYMLFVSVPIIWFFYFVVSFFQKPGRFHVLGVTFCLMLLMTTYIPFYFLVALLSFLVVFSLVYFSAFAVIWNRFVSFFCSHKFFVSACALTVLLVTLPGALFFLEAGKGKIEVSGRHYNTTETHGLAVQNQAEDSWAVPEEFYFSAYYSDLRRIVLAIVYVPCFAFIPLILGAGIKISRLMVFLALWSGVILLFTSPFASPLYVFLRTHIFLFKYFRNLHFFLWFVLIPIFVLFVAEQFRLFREAATRNNRLFLFFWVVIGHVALGVLLYRQPDVLPSTLLTVVFSLFFFLAYIRWESFRSPRIVAVCLFVLVLLQPLEVFYYLMRNQETSSFKSSYDSFSNRVAYHSTGVLGEAKQDWFPGDALPARQSESPLSGFYYATNHYSLMRSFVGAAAVSRFEHNKFLLFDQITSIKNSVWDWAGIERAMANNENMVWIEGEAPVLPLIFSGQPPERIDGSSNEFRIIRFGSNSVDLETNFSSPRFLVWTDAWYPAWQARLNAKAVSVFCVNGAYKGVFVPAGKSRITFFYVTLWRYVFECFLLGCFYLFFVLLVVSGCRKGFFRE